MASTDSKFDDLSDVGIDSLIDDSIPKRHQESNCLGNICFVRHLANKMRRVEILGNIIQHWSFPSIDN